MRKEQSIKTNNNQMKEKGMKSRFIHFKKRFVPALSGALMGGKRSNPCTLTFKKPLTTVFLFSDVFWQLW